MFFNGVWFCCRIINLYLKELGQILVKRRLKTSFLNMRLTLIFVSLVLKFGTVGQRQCNTAFYYAVLCKAFGSTFRLQYSGSEWVEKGGGQNFSKVCRLEPYFLDTIIIAVIVFWTRSWSVRQTCL